MLLSKVIDDLGLGFADQGQLEELAANVLDGKDVIECAKALRLGYIHESTLKKFEIAIRP